MDNIWYIIMINVFSVLFGGLITWYCSMTYYSSSSRAIVKDLVDIIHPINTLLRFVSNLGTIPIPGGSVKLIRNVTTGRYTLYNTMDVKVENKEEYKADTGHIHIEDDINELRFEVGKLWKELGALLIKGN